MLSAKYKVDTSLPPKVMAISIFEKSDLGNRALISGTSYVTKFGTLVWVYALVSNAKYEGDSTMS